ncbi:MAG: pilus assembly PilX N-terminal domain-containing protein [Patescibacteria group bacterium]|jgi:hypothetical protein
MVQRESKKESGAALVMSLLILLLTMVSAVALSRIILGEIRVTINSSNSLQAFYAADSGIEKGLYYTTYNRKNKNAVPLNKLKEQIFLVGVSQQSVYFAGVVTTTSGFAFDNVGVYSPAHVDIVDPTGNLPTPIDWDSNSTNSHYYKLAWSIDNCFPEHASDRLESTIYSFTGAFNTAIDKDIDICNCTFKAPSDIDYNKCTPITKSILDNRFYRFSFKPLDGTVKTMSFDVFDDVGNDGNISNDIITNISSDTLLTVDGIYKNAIYRLKAEVPSLFSASNLFSYVIFSEEGLQKAP